MRLGIISDVHGNLLALRSVLAELDAAGIDRLICLGDVVGYGPDPIECLDLILERDPLMVAGNHEDALLHPELGRKFREVAREAIDWTRRRLASTRPDLLDAIGRLPGMIYFESKVMIVHDSPIPGGARYILDGAAAETAFRGVDVPICLVGHTHLPACFRLLEDAETSIVESHRHVSSKSIDVDFDGRCIVNPGSVGQPRDGDPRASYAILDLEAGEIEWYRAGYDISSAQSRAIASGLPARVAERLALGA
jgi:predicted phosphodiesterase